MLGSVYCKENECFSAIFATPSAVLPMIVATGKNINDLGDFDACSLHSDTDYGLFYLKGAPIYLGLCVPSICKNEDLQIVADALTKLIEKIPSPVPIQAEGVIHFPNKEVPTVSAGHVFGFIGFGLLGVCLILGLFVEYTSLFSTQLTFGDDMNESQQDKALIKSKTLLGKTLLAFSPARNLRKMFYTPQRDDDYLTVLNGVRVISMYMVILGHTGSIMVSAGVSNPQSNLDLLSSWWAILIGAGFYSVDTFFFISAFLATYLMIDKFHGKKIFNIPMVYFHRLLRVIPTILMLTAFLLTFFEFMGSGPLWKPFVDQESANCRKSWWVNIVFMTSWYNSPRCFGQLWYLSNEMTYFLLVPFIVLAYLNSKLIGYIVIGFFNLISVILPFVFSHIRGHGITILNTPAVAYVSEIYLYPYTRSGSYAVGVLFGVLYFEWNKSRTDPRYKLTMGARFYDKIRESTIVCYTCLIIPSLIMLSFIILPRVELRDLYNRHISQIPSDFFNAFHRSGFVTALAFFLAPMLVGRMSFIKDVFGGKLWAPWAKVTFMSFLIHLNILGWYFYQSKGALFLDGPANIFYSLGFFLITVIISVPFSISLESPILQLERLVLFPPKVKPQAVSSQNYLINETKDSLNTKEESKSLKIMDN
ncbi:unnamed protein product [Moneuplotes crassus]|uniref:Acyltransferase 3 domain-containing protein n=1 Tax=Euplotes crassus TaxID=5936 RepID=A0AAD1U644_EUPCR|nr:unnamed protein product [Moneuplotes crassus]